LALDRLEHVGNKRDGTNAEHLGDTMLALAITALFTLSGVIAAAVIADCLIRARTAYVRLTDEAEALRAALVLEIAQASAAVDLRLRIAARPAARAVTVRRRPGLVRQPLLQACAAA
jgi:hypothetical protein